MNGKLAYGCTEQLGGTSPLLLIFTDGNQPIPLAVESWKHRFQYSAELTSCDDLQHIPYSNGGIVALIVCSVSQWKPLIHRFLAEQIPSWSLAIIPQASFSETDCLLSLGFDKVVHVPVTEQALDSIIRDLESSVTANTTRKRYLRLAGLRRLIGESPSFLEVKERVLVCAGMESPVLLSGETGTGKELCARAIHYLSSRAGKPFVPVDCGTLPEQLVENELFGHAKGAYTGATESYGGLVADACGGTLFLDDINCLPIATQAKLLRFLEDRRFKRVGSSSYCRANVRIISASNADLQHEVEQGRFRVDLYYRINVLNISLPSLRTRYGDIPLLVNYYLSLFSDRDPHTQKQISDQAMTLLCQYRWPGNVRELKNVIEKAVVFASNDVIRPEDLQDSVRNGDATQQTESFKSIKTSAEKEFLERALRLNHWNITKTAESTGKDRRSLQRLMRKHGFAAAS